MLLLLLAAAVPLLAGANLLSPGVSTETLLLNPSNYQLIGFPHSALNQSEVGLRFICEDNADYEFQVQYVLRSSPCDKEFFDARRGDRVQELLQFYFEEDARIPDYYSYDKIVFYRSPNQTMSCKNSNGKLLFDPAAHPMVEKNVTAVHPYTRSKRAVYPGLNGETLDGGAKASLSSWHPAQRMPVDGIYFLVARIMIVDNGKPEAKQSHNVTMQITWRGPYGYLSAIDYPLLRFYTLMCVFYGVLAVVWMVLSIIHYKDILRIQYWIGAVIIVGMVEKAVFYSEYATMNDSGTSVQGVIEMAEIVSCLKRTMSRVLIIIVSVGYGVVKPRLGNTLSQVAGVGFVYFIFCAIEGLARVSKNHVEAAKQKQFAALPLVITEMLIFYWIFTSLTGTMRTLRIRRNEVKLSVYRHFLNTLVFAVAASVVFMTWSLTYHIFPTCLKDWKELWVDTAFWHVLFCSILVVIMILWRPSQNNRGYAFTPLLDDSEDENDDDELFSTAPAGFEAVSMRQTGSGAENRRAREAAAAENRLQEDLKWIEDNIPSSLTDHLLMDDEEDKEARDLEMSKML